MGDACPKATIFTEQSPAGELEDEDPTARGKPWD